MVLHLLKFVYCCDQGKLDSPYMQRLLLNPLSQQVSNFALNWISYYFIIFCGIIQLSLFSLQPSFFSNHLIISVSFQAAMA